MPGGRSSGTRTVPDPMRRHTIPESAQLEHIEEDLEIAVEPDTSEESATVIPVVARLKERPPREIRIGVGLSYSKRMRPGRWT